VRWALLPGTAGVGGRLEWHESSEPGRDRWFDVGMAALRSARAFVGVRRSNVRVGVGGGGVVDTGLPARGGGGRAAAREDLVVGIGSR